MKVTFEFDTTAENFDRFELQRYYDADRMAYCLHRILTQVREWDKYDPRADIFTGEVYDTIWEIIHSEVDMERLGY